MTWSVLGEVEFAEGRGACGDAEVVVGSWQFGCHEVLEVESYLVPAEFFVRFWCEHAEHACVEAADAVWRGAGDV